MVIQNIHRSAFLLLLLLTSFIQQTVVAASLEVRVNQNKQIYGKPIEAELHAINTNTSLDTVSLAPVLEKFHVEAPDNAYLVKKNHQVKKLLLFARQAGSVTIPPLKIGNIISKPVKTRFTPSASITSTRPLGIDNSWNRKEITLGQAFIYKTVIETDDAFATLKIHPSSSSKLNTEVFPVRRTSFKQDNKTRYRYTAYQALFPKLAGQIDVIPGSIEYQVNGITQYRYYTDKTRLTVSAPPVYLPPYTPMGKITIQSKIRFNTRRFLLPETNRLMYWDIMIQADNIEHNHIPGILRHVKSNASLQFLPVEISKSSEYKNENISRTVLYRIPFIVKQSGQTRLPELKVHYFTSEQRRIITHKHRKETFFAVNPWLQYSAYLLFISIIFMLAGKGVPVLAHSFRKHKQIRHYLYNIQDATNIHEIQHSLSGLSDLFGWNKNITMERWLEQWALLNPQQKSLKPLGEKMSCCRYSKYNCELEAIRQELSESLKNISLKNYVKLCMR